MSDRVLDLLVRELGITEDEVYRQRCAARPVGALGPRRDRTHGRTSAPRRSPPACTRRCAARAARWATSSPPCASGDVLLHHPYDSFATSVQAFIEQAAGDPAVLALKLTLYRTSGESPIVDALVDAARSGKQVLVVVEIKARFDEQANIRWARKLEQAGCHVVYGLVNLKTHCKLALVVRSEADGRLRRYVHVGTGNYNPKTARTYEDLGLLTADPAVGADVADLFNHLSGYTRHRKYDTLLVAPDDLRAGLLALIRARRPSTAQGQAAPASRSRSTAWSTRRSSTRSTTRRGPASPSTCGSAACARCAPASPACPRPSGSAASSAASSSTRGSTGSSHGGDDRGAHRQRRPHGPQPRPPGRGAGAGQRPGEPPSRSRGCSRWPGATTSTTGRCPPTASGPGRRAARRLVDLQSVLAERAAGRLTVVAAGGAQVEAAGGVLWRGDPAGPEVCLVHRPRYDDWSLPKGKLELGERPLLGALREIAEETGFPARPGVGLGSRALRRPRGTEAGPLLGLRSRRRRLRRQP